MRWQETSHGMWWGGGGVGEWWGGALARWLVRIGWRIGTVVGAHWHGGYEMVGVSSSNMNGDFESTLTASRISL
jgi:hypothetical protein